MRTEIEMLKKNSPAPPASIITLSIFQTQTSTLIIFEVINTNRTVPSNDNSPGSGFDRATFGSKMLDPFVYYGKGCTTAYRVFAIS